MTTNATTKTMNNSSNDTANELCLLLSKLNIKTILQTHDTISCEYYTKFDDYSVINDNVGSTTSQQHISSVTNDAVDSNSQINDESSLLLSKAEYYCVENLKLVNIDKAEAPLGATIRNIDGSIVIGRIVKGGAADLSGLLHEDDEILEVNGVPVRGKTINDVSEMLVRIMIVKKLI